MIVRRVLLWLPIHDQSREEFSEERQALHRRSRQQLEDVWKTSFDAIPLKVRADSDEQLQAGPWFLQAIVGFLSLGHDGGRCIAGDVYLFRRLFPRGARERRGSVKKSTRVMDECLPYAETARYELREATSDAYRIASEQVIAEAQGIVKTRVRTGVVWVPSFGLDCIDLAKADARLAT